MHHSRPRGHCLFTSLITALEIIVVQNYTEFGEGNVRNLKGQRAQTVVNKIIKFISLLSWEAMVAVVLLLCQVPIPSKETPVSSPYCFFFCMTILQWTWYLIYDPFPTVVMDKPPAHEQCSCPFFLFQVLFGLMQFFKVKCSIGLETLKDLQYDFSVCLFRILWKLKNIIYNTSKFVV